jgi:2-methylisocitrate lyase-like PEP mutase family enzyme
MISVSQHAKAIQFRHIHTGGPLLVLPNAWDAGSVRLFE